MISEKQAQFKLAYQTKFVIAFYGIALFLFAYGHHHQVEKLLTFSFFMSILASVGLITTLINIFQFYTAKKLKNNS